MDRIEDKVAIGAGVFLLAAGALANSVPYCLCGIGYIMAVRAFIADDAHKKIVK